ncbi:acetolactate decarboxylase [Planctomycetota bacterium]|nr:acetolactate decarboxylase [Planctomycetota bacterium]
MKFISQHINRLLFLTAIILIGSLLSCERKSGTGLEDTNITQIGTIHTLFAGQYDGIFTSKELSKYGDYGLGTFNALDGELIQFDGVIYKAAADGTLKVVEPSQTIPYATTTFFKPSIKYDVTKEKRLVDVADKLIYDNLININHVYAVNIQGDFEFILYRSWPKQNPPYRPLDQLVVDEKRHIARNIKANLVGFYYPMWFGQVNTNGFHYHFISDDKMIGGHVLEGNITNGIIDIMPINQLTILDLPVLTIQPRTSIEKPPVPAPTTPAPSVKPQAPGDTLPQTPINSKEATETIDQSKASEPE